MNTIEYLLKHSHLPGPRGNLSLLYSFSLQADEQEVRKCLDYITPDVSNSPEEFVGMCGIVGYAIRCKNDLKQVLAFLKPYASHSSWRIREAVAIAIQEISENRTMAVIAMLDDYVCGNSFEQRALIAGLCEPKLLITKEINREIIGILATVTKTLNHNQKLTSGESALRKTLGYAWSVVIVKIPDEGQKYFETLLSLKSKHIAWIIKENLKKKRLIRMNAIWTSQCLKRIL